MWCCKTAEDECITEGGNYYSKHIICNGTALSLSDQCHDEKHDRPSCNYYPMDNLRYLAREDETSRAYLPLCRDNRYICETFTK